MRNFKGLGQPEHHRVFLTRIADSDDADPRRLEAAEVERRVIPDAGVDQLQITLCGTGLDEALRRYRTGVGSSTGSDIHAAPSHPLGNRVAPHFPERLDLPVHGPEPSARENQHVHLVELARADLGVGEKPERETTLSKNGGLVERRTTAPVQPHNHRPQWGSDQPGILRHWHELDAGLVGGSVNRVEIGSGAKRRIDRRRQRHDEVASSWFVLIARDSQSAGHHQDAMSTPGQLIREADGADPIGRGLESDGGRT